MAVFETLGQLSDHLSAGGIQVVDPGVPLEEITVSSDDLWAHQPSVRKVVGFIARNVASIPLHVYERVSDEDRQRVTDHPLAAVAKRPAPRTTAYRFWELVLIDWLLRDRWCVLKSPTPDGMELVRIPPRLWRLKADGLDRVTAVLILQDGRWVERDPAGFVFDHGYARVGANGTSPAQTLKTLLAEQAEAVAYRRGVWRNGARVPAVIERPKDAPQWSPEARNRFTRSWRNFVQGGGQEGGTPLLEDGMKLVPVEAFKPQDTQDLEGRKLTDIEVATAYFLAPELLGIREGTYSNVESFRQSLYRDALGPYISAWEQALNVMLTPDLAGGRDLYIEAHVESKLRGSFEEQATILSTSTGAPWLTRNEARARSNLPAVEGGDDLVTPLNVLVGGLASPRDTAGPSRGGSAPAASDTGATPSADDIVKLVTAAGTLIRAGFDPEASLEAVGLDPIRHLGLLPVTVQTEKARTGAKGLEPGLAPVEQERQALEADLARYQGQLADSLLSGLGAKAAPPLADVFDLDGWNAVLAALIVGRSRRIAQAAAAEVLDEWNPERDGWDPDVMDPWLGKAAQTNARRANQKFYDDLAAALTGDGWQDAVRSVLTADGFPSVWALTIGTEVASFGRHDAASASGLDTKTWRTRSGHPRSSHKGLSGVTVGIHEVFSNGARWPGDWRAGAAEVVNCSCTLDYSRGEP